MNFSMPCITLRVENRQEYIEWCQLNLIERTWSVNQYIDCSVNQFIDYSEQMTTALFFFDYPDDATAFKLRFNL